MSRDQDTPSLDKDNPVRIKLPTPETYLVIYYCERCAPEPHPQARAAPEPRYKDKARATSDPRSQRDYSEKITDSREKRSLYAELPA